MCLDRDQLLLALQGQYRAVDVVIACGQELVQVDNKISSLHVKGLEPFMIPIPKQVKSFIFITLSKAVFEIVFITYYLIRNLED